MKKQCASPFQANWANLSTVANKYNNFFIATAVYPNKVPQYQTELQPGGIGSVPAGDYTRLISVLSRNVTIRPHPVTTTQTDHIANIIPD